MEFTGIGGGIMLAIAAGLWLVYLVPNWLRQREYLATERNAVRLQQTIRVLAETSEIPAAVRAEAVARRVAQQFRVEGPVAVGRPPVRHAPGEPHTRATAMRRLRRSRAVMALLLLASIVAAIVQVSIMVTAGVAAGSWLVLGVAMLGGVSSFAMLGRLAEATRARTSSSARAPRRTSLDAGAGAVPMQRQVAWTPVPVPKPLYLSRAAAESRPAIDPTFELQLAAASAERTLRVAEQQAAPIRPAAAPASTSRFASMGIVDDTSGTVPDLDAMLARRRAAG